jgi:two-component system, cell cycle sensor histidine kinase PleC
MARGNTASVQLRAKIQREADTVLPLKHRRKLTIRALAFAATALVIATFVLAGCLLWYADIQAHDEVYDRLARETELTAAYLKNELTRLSDPHSISPAKMQADLMASLPRSFEYKKQSVVVTGSDGLIKAAIPVEAASIVDPKAPSIANSDGLATVSLVTLPTGDRAITASVRMTAPFGDLTVIAPIPNGLELWRGPWLALSIVLVTVGLVCTCLVSGLVWLVTRLHRSGEEADIIRDRIDMALNRGRAGLWDWDIASGKITWSRSMSDILGLTHRDEALSFGEVTRRIHPEDQELYAIADRLAAEQTDTIDHVFRMLNADDEWIWVRLRAELVKNSQSRNARLVGIVTDITDQQRLAFESETADVRLRDAIETIGEAFVLWDADNKLVLCNSKFQDLNNLPGNLVRPGTSYDVVAPYLTTFKPIAQQDRHHGIGQDQSYEMLLPEGRWLQVNERQTKDGGYVSVGTDITALKNEEHRYQESERKLTATISDLKRSRQTLETQAEQLTALAERYLEQKAEAETANRAKSEFLAKMSHELRTPLNAILGFADIMSAEIYGPLGHAKYSDYSHDILKSGHSLLTIIADILDMAELEAGRIRIDKRPLILSDVARDVIEKADPDARAKSQKIIADLSSTSPLMADYRAIERIISHLVSNAIKFTPEGGRITVTTREVSGAINLYVDDTGIGIPKESLSKLGRPFEWVELDAKKPTEGAGLGLAIARSFAELHGGTLTIRSTEGTGTTVLVRLPIRSGPPMEQAA